MAPALLFALALFAADPDAPVATAVPAPAPAAPAPTARPDEPPFPTGAPTDDYGLVAWCYGALKAHMDLHDKVMPEVTRIEKQWEKTPGSSADELKAYEEQRIEGVRALAQFRRAMEAAEKASVKPIQAQGAAAIQRGAAIWNGAAKADARRLAQEWMSWALPARCMPTAKTLEARASLLGQALNYNAKAAEAAAAAAAAPPEPAPAEETPSIDSVLAEPDAPAAEDAPDLGLRGLDGGPPPAEAAPAPEPAPPTAEPEPAVEAPAAEEPVTAEPTSSDEPAAADKPADFIIDVDNPQPCPGLIEPTERDGKSVLICKVNS